MALSSGLEHQALGDHGLNRWTFGSQVHSSPGDRGVSGFFRPRPQAHFPFSPRGTEDLSLEWAGYLAHMLLLCSRGYLASVAGDASLNSLAGHSSLLGCPASAPSVPAWLWTLSTDPGPAPAPWGFSHTFSLLCLVTPSPCCA